MELDAFFGIMGAVTGNVLFLPQIIKSLQTKHTQDLSLWTYVLILYFDICQITFGYFIHQPIIIISNAVSTFLTVLLIELKRRYGLAIPSLQGMTK